MTGAKINNISYVLCIVSLQLLKCVHFKFDTTIYSKGILGLKVTVYN